MENTSVALANQLQIGDNLVMRRPENRAETENSGPIAGSLPENSLETLIQRAQSGDSAAMESIYNRYKTALFNLAYRYTYNHAAAEDLLQEIFIKVFSHIGDVNRTATFTAWVYRIGLNTCYSYLREKRVEFQNAVPLDDVEGVVSEPGDAEADGDLRRSLEEAIAALPPKLREVFLLHDVQGLKHQEIGRVLGLSTGTSKSQLFKARLRIREFLKRKEVL
jgi:RNA polymerase sigma-70 factor (ECF subfamily)